MLKHNMMGHINLGERILMQSASYESNRIIAIMASYQAGYQIEERLQASAAPLHGHIAEPNTALYGTSTTK